MASWLSQRPMVAPLARHRCGPSSISRMLTISYGELSGDRQSSKADILDLRPEVLAKGLGCMLVKSWWNELSQLPNCWVLLPGDARERSCRMIMRSPSKTGSCLPCTPLLSSRSAHLLLGYGVGGLVVVGTGFGIAGRRRGTLLLRESGGAAAGAMDGAPPVTVNSAG
jgi:hypothetical protein